MATWIFQGNPDNFNIDGYLSSGLSRITWVVQRYGQQILVGDRVFIWRAQGKTEKAISGVVAEAVVDSEIWSGKDDKTSRPFWKTDAAGAEANRVWLRLVKVANKKQIIERDWLKDDPILRELLIIKQPAGTNFSVNEEQEKRLVRLWERVGKPWNRAEIIAALWAYVQTYDGAVSKVAGSPVADTALLIGRAVTGVYNKLMNLRSVDPRDPRQGLKGGGNDDKLIWNEFFDPVTYTVREGTLKEEYLRLWHSTWTPEDTHAENLIQEVAVLEKKSLEELLNIYNNNKKSGKPRVGKTTTTVFERNPQVIAIAKKRAENRCEVPGCLYEPFKKKDGDVYLEVHHIIPLAEGGDDVPGNAACLCPSHHREIHHGENSLMLRQALLNIRNNDKSS